MFLIDYWNIQKDVPYGKIKTSIQIRNGYHYPWPNFFACRPFTIPNILNKADWSPGSYPDGIKFDSGGKLSLLVKNKLLSLEDCDHCIDCITDDIILAK